MARKQVVEVQCDRCARVEHRVDQGTKHETTLYVSFVKTDSSHLEAAFEDLCGPCRETVEGHLMAATKKIDGQSPDRKKKAGDDPVERIGKALEAEAEEKQKDTTVKNTPPAMKPLNVEAKKKEPAAPPSAVK